MNIRRIIILAMMISAPVSAQVRPVIFVPAESGYAWWARTLAFRPSSKSLGSIDIDQLNRHLEAKRGMATAKSVCLVDFVTVAGVVSADRATQKEIDETFNEFPQSFAVNYRAGLDEFAVRVVAYEACGKDPDAGTAILITDKSGALRSFDIGEFVFTRLFKRDDGKINVFGCFACGDVSELNYDVGNQQFYYKWVGH